MARTERLLALANLLRDRKRMSFDHMMARLEVSPATLKRDLKYLREQLGTPVEYDAFDGTYQVAESSLNSRRELPGVWFSDSELYALMLAQRFLSQIDPLGLLAPRLRGVIHRVQGLLDESGREPSLVHRVKLSVPGQRSVDSECFAIVTQALSERRQLRFQYGTRNRQGAAPREVSPQRLFHHRTWYLDGWCHQSGALQRFALEWMDTPALTHDAAVDVAPGELEKALDGGYGALAGGSARWAVLMFSQAAASSVERERWHAKQQTRLLADGRLELMVPFDDPTELVMDILRYGDQVEVMGDPLLREAVGAQARAVADFYRQ